MHTMHCQNKKCKQHKQEVQLPVLGVPIAKDHVLPGTPACGSCGKELEHVTVKEP